MTTDRDLAMLTGEAAPDLLAAALGTAGGELVSWRVRDVDHRPGGSTTASYRAVVRWADEERTETLGVTTSEIDPAAPGVLSLSDGERTVSVWRFPQDPALPALATATDPPALASVLRSVGIGDVDEDGASLRVTVRAYRPRRRAVIEVVARTARLFVKVLRPTRVRDLHERHRLLSEAGMPTPHSLGCTDEGLLLLRPLYGTSLRKALWDPGAALPTPGRLVEVLDRLPEAILELPRRTSWTEGAAHYGALLGAALSEEADRVAGLAGEVSRLTAMGAPDEPVHGDFYEAQLLVRDGQITGLLDVDTAGPGRRADDLACVVGHLAVLGTMRPEHQERLTALAASWFDELAFRGGRRSAASHGYLGRRGAQAVDPADFAARVAGVVLSLATGPHRVQERDWQDSTRRRLDVVEHWVGRAGRGGEA